MAVEPASLSQAQSVRRLSRREPYPRRRRRIRQRDKFLGEVDLDLPTACRGGPSPSDTVISEHRNPCEKTMTDDAAWPLAQHVCRTGYADLPASAVESAPRDVLDTFGCMLGGSGSPGIDELFAVISRWPGIVGRRLWAYRRPRKHWRGSAGNAWNLPANDFAGDAGGIGFHLSLPN